MRDFDAERTERRSEEDRTFKLAGQTFVVRDRFRPEVLFPLESLEDAVTDKTTCNCDHRLHEHNDNGTVGACQAFGCDCKKFSAKILDPGSPLPAQLEAIDSTIEGLLLPVDGAVERYKAIRADENFAVDVSEMMEIVKWATQKDAGHPTGLPSVSSPGPAQTGTSSTDVSSQPVLVAG